jgi:prepilin-type N-terminal cleavage/methylation domain-containing protein
MRSVHSNQDGFSLIELLVAMSMVVVIFGATLTVLEVFTRQAQGNTQRNDAQNQARLGIDLIVRQLRNISSPIASPKLVERAAPYDLVFQTVGPGPVGANASGAQRVRYCIPQDTPAGAPGNEVLYSQTQTWTTAQPPTSPWSADPSVTIPCPDTSATTLAQSVSTGRVVVPSVTNRYLTRTDRPAFSYNDAAAPSDLSKITSVQLDLFVNPTPQIPGAETELRSAAFLRNQLRAPETSFTSTATGSGGVLLNGGTSYSPDGEDLSFSWACTAPTPCPAASTLAGSATGLVTWQPGPGTYTVVLTTTDTTGLSSTATGQVTVS